MRRTHKLLAIIVCTAAVWATNQATARAGEKVYVGAPCRVADRPSLDDVDHAAFDKLLGKYVDEAGLVNYTAWKRSQDDVARLDQYLARAGCVDLRKRAAREAKLAYWINLYNAVTIKGILREYPTTSIRNHTGRFFGYNIWKDLQVWVDGRRYSLTQMEHDVLREMGDPRIHFAIVCASMGCPKLRNAAYTADKLNEQLDANARAFFAQRDKFRADLKSRTLYVSPILKWFATDFGPSQNAQLRRIAEFLPDGAARLAESGNVYVRYLTYDWGINDQKSR